MSDRSDGPPAVPAEWQNLGRQFRHFQVLFVAVKAGIPAALSVSPKTLTELSEQLGFAAPRLLRVLQGLIWCGALDRDSDGFYFLTATGQTLVGEEVSSFASGLRFEGEFFFQAWGHLWDYLQSGDTPFANAHGGESFFNLLEKDENLSALFGAPLTMRSSEYSARIATRPALSERSGAYTIVDVGGGEGGLLADLLKAQPNAQGVLLELPVLEASATRLLSEAGLSARCRFVAGDMFAAVPAEGDIYLLKWVLHDWNDADAVRILRRCAEAMRHGDSSRDEARLLVIERLMHETVDAANAGLVQADLNMLCQMGGAERTLAQYGSLLARADVRLVSATQVDEFYGFFALECAATAC